MILTRKLALGVAAVAAAGVLGTAGVAAATSDHRAAAPAAAAAPTGTAAPSSSPAPSAGKGERRERVRRALHGEWVVKGKAGLVTVVSVRGEVTAVGPASVTVKAEDGYTATFAANADTKVKGADVHALADVTVGAKAAVVGVRDGDTLTARAVLVRK